MIQERVSLGLYVLISQVQSRPDLISMVTGCLPRVQQPLQLEDTEDGVAAMVFWSRSAG